MSYRPSSPIDHCAVYYDLLSAMDAAEKSVIPGRYPWRTRKTARRWMSDEYRQACDTIAASLNVGISTIMKHGPGVSCSLARVSEKFEEAGL